MKKVYFACSVRGGRVDQPFYEKIVEIIKQHAEVLSEAFIDKNLTSQGMPKPAREIWETDIAMLKSADAIIAEVTNPSLGVGYEVAKAEEQGKPILCLYRPQKDRSLSGMIAGNPKIRVIEYENVEELEKPIRDFLEAA